jgi:segregation and condensation protein A
VTDEADNKPFWLRPPYVILFDLIRLQRLRPWDVNVTFLLNSFLSEMKKSGYIDFTASGTALLSSAIIHRMKSEFVLKLEEPPRPPVIKPNEQVPPPLPIPIRYEYVSASVEHLLAVLEEVLQAEKVILSKQSRPVVLPSQLSEDLDEFLTNINERLEDFYLRLQKLSKKTSAISFVSLTKGLSAVEMVRQFILVLFLACQGRLVLLQEQEFGDIIIRLMEMVPRIGAD